MIHSGVGRKGGGMKNEKRARNCSIIVRILSYGIPLHNIARCENLKVRLVWRIDGMGMAMRLMLCYAMLSYPVLNVFPYLPLMKSVR